MHPFRAISSVVSCSSCKLQLPAIGNGSGLVPGLKNLAKVILRENHCVFLLCGMQGGIPHVEQIGTQRKVRTMLFENAKRQ